MQKLRTTLIIFLLSCTLTACATQSLTQANKAMAVRHVATQTVLALLKNDTDAVLKRMHFTKDRANKERSRIKKRAHQANQYAKKMGGVASLHAGDVSYSDAQKRAKIQVTVKFNNGNTMTKSVSLRYINNHWLVGR